jgi:phage-related protein
MIEELKPISLIASSRKDLKAFPEDVQDDIGFALYRAQQGRKHAKAKPKRRVLLVQSL